MSNTVLITGAGGFVGGQTALHFKDKGWQVFGIDRSGVPSNLSNFFDGYLQADFSERDALNYSLTVLPDAVIHCAASASVGESVKNPKLYYENNFVKTKRFVDFLIEHSITSKFVFSSSAAVYGEPVLVPCSEEDPLLPINPYGESKLMCEQMLRSYQQAFGFNSVILRYFNACGADPQGRHGQRKDASHIIARALESAIYNRRFVINGNDFSTNDGTCVRDYVHVQDIARAHYLAVANSVPAGIYNLSTGTGTSNQEVLSLVKSITGTDVQFDVGAKRPGDPACLTASSNRFAERANWQHQYNISDMIAHAYQWYQKTQ